MKLYIISILTLLALMVPTQASAEITDKSNPLYEFVPEGYKIQWTKQVNDLNGDEMLDMVLVVKNTKPSNIVKSEFTGEMHDLNRRGLVVLFATEDGFTKAAENLECFASDEEDAFEGVYYETQLFITHISESSNLIFGLGNHDATEEFFFNYQDGGFKLVAYNCLEGESWCLLKKTSLNFLTAEKHEFFNQLDVEEICKQYEADPEGYEDKFTEQCTAIERKPLIDFSEVKDFNTLSSQFEL